MSKIKLYKVISTSKTRWTPYYLGHVAVVVIFVSSFIFTDIVFKFLIENILIFWKTKLEI